MLPLAAMVDASLPEPSWAYKGWPHRAPDTSLDDVVAEQLNLFADDFLFAVATISVDALDHVVFESQDRYQRRCDRFCELPSSKLRLAHDRTAIKGCTDGKFRGLLRGFPSGNRQMCDGPKERKCESGAARSRTAAIRAL